MSNQVGHNNNLTKTDKLNKFDIEPLSDDKIEFDSNMKNNAKIAELGEEKNENKKNKKNDLGLSRISLESSTYLSDTELSAKLFDRPVLPNRKDNLTFINNLQNII